MRCPTFVLTALTVAGVLATAGCTPATNQPGNGMGGGGGGASSSGMMGGGAGGSSTGGMGGYRYSRLMCHAPASLPGQWVTVSLADMGMTQMMGGTAPMGVHMSLKSSSQTVAAGTITLIAQNRGWRTHELVLLPLEANTTAGHRVPGPDGKVSETGSLGEASASCAAGTGHGITARSTGWITLTLAPGRYELVCNRANHYADGMRTELTVT